MTTNKDQLIEKLKDIQKLRKELVRNPKSSEDAFFQEYNNVKIEEQINNLLNELISALESSPSDQGDMIITTEQRVHELYQAPFNGHPSREDDSKNKAAILFLAKQIDILHKLRITTKK